MFTEVLTGLQHLHAQNIVHRDLKLSNLLLTSDMQVKISDFGLSVVLCSERGESGTMCGTPNYMSPEVISSSPHGLASDVWSLGCLLYECLTGRGLFSGDTVSDSLAAILRKDPDWSALPAETPAIVKRLLQRAEGYDYTIVAGEIIAERGSMTEARPGRVVRGPQG